MTNLTAEKHIAASVVSGIIHRVLLGSPASSDDPRAFYAGTIAWVESMRRDIAALEFGAGTGIYRRGGDCGEYMTVALRQLQSIEVAARALDAIAAEGDTIDCFTGVSRV